MKIGDYGLAKFISCSRRSGQTESVGTVHYMAPEIANGRYGREIDIYALGIMLYEMLTGRVPFEGESVGEVLMKHLTAEPDLSALDEPYRDIVQRALAKDPERAHQERQRDCSLLARRHGSRPVQSQSGGATADRTRSKSLRHGAAISTPSPNARMRRNRQSHSQRSIASRTASRIASYRIGRGADLEGIRDGLAASASLERQGRQQFTPLQRR